MKRTLTEKEQAQRQHLAELLKDRPKPVIEEWGIPHLSEE